MTKNDILAFLKTQFALDTQDLDENTGLFSEGLLDSFRSWTWLFIENTGGIKMQPTDVNLDNLDSVAKILAYVAREGVAKS